MLADLIGWASERERQQSSQKRKEGSQRQAETNKAIRVHNLKSL